jgi:nicotinate dehydrogenase subunit A
MRPQKVAPFSALKISSLEPFQSAVAWNSVRPDAPTGSRIGAGPATNGRSGAIPGSSANQEDIALMAQKFTLNVNGRDHTVDVDPDMPLLYALRNDIGLNNPHFGCGLAQCGACTVHLDGQAIRSCVTPVSAVGNAKVVTLAGLGTPEKPHPLQTAYVEEQVPQCGYCINGWIMTAAAFLRDKKKPTDAEIKTALEGLKCRCGTHMGIMRAVKRASEMMG